MPGAQVLGPCFESMARYWTMHFAARGTLGGGPDHVEPTILTVMNGETGVEEPREIDVVVTADDATVCALGRNRAHCVVERRPESASAFISSSASE